jgi:hypothetical protein
MAGAKGQAHSPRRGERWMTPTRNTDPSDSNRESDIRENIDPDLSVRRTSYHQRRNFARVAEFSDENLLIFFVFSGTLNSQPG